MKKKVVILGGGIAGVAAAKWLKDVAEVEVYEKDKIPGGLLKTYEEKGFLFDLGGHLFHFKDRSFSSLFESLMRDNYFKLQRKAFIYLQGEIVPFPFQVHLFKLPEKVKFRCLKDFLDARHSPKKTFPSNFEEWLLFWFGKGMCDYFFFPYNKKFWKEDLKKFSSEWAEWAVPKPSVEQVIQGARGEVIEGLGYNPNFYYPIKGGSFAFFKKFSDGVSIFTEKEVVKISLEKKRILFLDGEEREFEYLISTIPLVEFLEKLDERDAQIDRIRKMLSATSLVIYNLGFMEKVFEGIHWIYFPEEEFPFHRLGVYSNFSSNMAPPEGTSLYLEVSFLKEPPEDEVLKISLDKLRNLGWIKTDPAVINKQILMYAYPHPTKDEKMALDFLLPFLESKGIFLAGRSGSWSYLSVEETLKQVQGIVKKLKLKLNS